MYQKETKIILFLKSWGTEKGKCFGGGESIFEKLPGCTCNGFPRSEEGDSVKGVSSSRVYTWVKQRFRMSLSLTI